MVRGLLDDTSSYQLVKTFSYIRNNFMKLNEIWNVGKDNKIKTSLNVCVIQ
jgi:hypothetical protein